MSIHDDLSAILREIEIISPAAFRFQGESIAVNPASMPTLPGFPTHPLPEMPLVRDLQGVLYERCYARRLGEPKGPSLEGKMLDPTFIPKLSASNRSRSGWEGGWSIYQQGQNGQVWLMKGDRQRSAVPGEFVTNGPPGVPPAVGAVVNVQVQREATAAQPAFYFMYGESLGDAWDDITTVRFYFHATVEGVTGLIEQLTLRLNRYQVPFRMKALNDPLLYGRTDAMVLYVARRHHDIVVRIIRDLPRDVTDALVASTPLFSDTLQAGIGVAEDPNTGESFGMNRCRMVAEGVADAWQRGDQSVEGRLRAIAERFEKNGMKLEYPHLSAGSVPLAEVSQEVEFAYA